MEGNQDRMLHVNAMGQITLLEDTSHAPVPHVPILNVRAEKRRSDTEEEEEEIVDIAEHWRSKKSTSSNISPLSVSKVADSIELKAEASYKQSLAERTGDPALRQQARFEQSIADRMGARKAYLPKPDKETMKYNAALKQSVADKTGDPALKRQASMHQSIADRSSKKAVGRKREPRKEEPRVCRELPQPEQPVNDLLELKYDSAIKQSIADRTGDLALKMQASMEQSVADSLGARQAMFQEPKYVVDPLEEQLLPLGTLSLDDE